MNFIFVDRFAAAHQAWVNKTPANSQDNTLEYPELVQHNGLFWLRRGPGIYQEVIPTFA